MLKLKDMLFCCISKTYYGKSSRRTTGYLTLAKSKKYISKVPHFNSVLNYYKNPSLTPILKHVIEQSGIPLRDVETVFATDASGFSTSLYGRWFDIRTEGYNKRKLYRKAHLSSGVKTNIVTAVSITEGYCHDSPQFIGLVKTTAKNYCMREMSADAGYLGRQNYQAVADVGAIPYIMFKSNCTSKARGCSIYKRMYELYDKHRDVFMKRYHQRSNSETVFSQIKRKFGLRLFSKDPIGQENELLCLILCHNICVLIHELFELNTDMNYSDCEKKVIRNFCATA